MISIIVAVSEDWGIGKDNELLWHISEDLKRFKKAYNRKDRSNGEKNMGIITKEASYRTEEYCFDR